ncbi:MAG: M23 family metallopeptidase [Deltaproteobacteria bacterium]|nr:M23 family metallopeptidase [Deltaproteobacteria bacterium]
MMFRIIKFVGIIAILIFFACETSFLGAKASERGLVETTAVDPITSCAIGRWLNNCDIKTAITRGLFETGLTPVFPEHTSCREIDEGYAISYSKKRPREMYHGGIDIPAPWGMPIIAAAAGEVVGVYHGNDSPRGVEIVLRHSPEDTGIPLWIYTQYTHFSEIPSLKVGQRVRMGEILGKTGNSGISPFTGKQSNKRRPALHFGVFYSVSSEYANFGDRIIQVDGHWMDPVALFRKELPLDSISMKALPEMKKQIPISVMLDNGEAFPANTKLVWPYACMQK